MVIYPNGAMVSYHHRWKRLDFITLHHHKLKLKTNNPAKAAAAEKMENHPSAFDFFNSVKDSKSRVSIKALNFDWA